MWDDGIYLGMKGSTGEVIVGNREGVWRTRTIQRKVESERWARINMEFIGGTPWRMSEGGETEGEGMKQEVRIMDKEYRERMRLEECEPVPRQVYIRKEDLETLGYTEGCPGCKSILRGTARQAHSIGCRKRIEKELEGTDKAKRARGRIDEYAARRVEEEDGERKRNRRSGYDGGGEVDGDVQIKGEDDGGERKEEGVGSSGSGEWVIREEKGEKRRKQAAEGSAKEQSCKVVKKAESKKRGREKDEGEESMGVDEVCVAGQVVNEDVGDEADDGWDWWWKDQYEDEDGWIRFK